MSRVFEILHGSQATTYQEEDLPLIIGSGPDCHIQLAGIGEKTAYIALADGHLFLQPDQPLTECFHNGHRVTRSVWIKAGDRVRIRDIDLLFRIQGDMVAIHVVPAARTTEKEHPLQPAPPGPLPRVVSRGTDRKPNRLLWSVAAGFSLLFFSLTLFLVKGGILTLDIQPEPDEVTVSGFPPAIALKGRYFAVPGTYSLFAAKEGYVPLRETLSFSPAAGAAFSYTLQKLPGILHVNSTPAQGVMVDIDNDHVGTTPIRELELEPGSHTIRLYGKPWRELTETIDIVGLGREQFLQYKLEPGWGTVTLQTTPDNAEVRMAEELLGRTSAPVAVPEGERTVTIISPGFMPHPLHLRVEGGASYHPPPITLEPMPATVDLQTDPPGASITVNTLFRGKTPLQLDLAAEKEQHIRFFLPGYEKVEQKIRFTAEKEHLVKVRLTPVLGNIFITADPPDAALTINGQPRKSGSTGKLRLQTEKNHTLVFSKQGYRSKTVKITPNSEFTQQLRIRLSPLQAAQQGSGRSKAKTLSRQRQQSGLFASPVRVTMGSSRREQGRRSNEHLRTVLLKRPVYLSTREVTNAEYRRFTPSHRSGSFARHTLDGDNQPVVNITWTEAARYCNRLSRQEGLPPFYIEKNGTMAAVQPANTGYRLPTEAEWAYAARFAGGSQPSRYPWQGTFPPTTVVGNFADSSIRTTLNLTLPGYNDGFPVSAPVGSFPPNGKGYFDLGGNVAEWCHDLYSPIPTSGKKEETDPLGPKAGAHHVVRGSSWRDGSIVELRLSYRSYGKNKRDNIGFRVARYLQ